jgi:3',5'-cyclic AMP phosphodiesterase CpdA
VPTRVLHLSDLHVGTNEEPAVEQALAALVTAVEPELVVASGDLTHRGRSSQHQRAEALLRSLGPPVLAIPGNHDIPLLPPARLTRPFAEFAARWQTTEPMFRSATLHAVGLNSVRPWRHQSGRVTDRQLERASEQLRDAAQGALRIVTLHHHLIGAPWRSRKRPVARRNHVLGRLVEAGAELILAGHIHQAAVSERREFELSSGEEAAVVVSIAPGLGQPRPRRRGEARGLHVYEAEETTLRVSTYIWHGRTFALTAERLYPRGARTLSSAR